MSEKYYIEGYRPKDSIDDEDTLIIHDDKAYPSLAEATAKAKEYFQKEQNLGLTVIFKDDECSGREGVKFINREKEGELEEFSLWW